MGILVSFSTFIVRGSFHQFLKMTVPVDKAETHTQNNSRSMIITHSVAKQSTGAAKT